MGGCSEPICPPTPGARQICSTLPHTDIWGLRSQRPNAHPSRLLLNLPSLPCLQETSSPQPRQWRAYLLYSGAMAQYPVMAHLSELYRPHFMSQGIILPVPPSSRTLPDGEYSIPLTASPQRSNQISLSFSASPTDRSCEATSLLPCMFGTIQQANHHRCPLNSPSPNPSSWLIPVTLLDVSPLCDFVRHVSA